MLLIELVSDIDKTNLKRGGYTLVDSYDVGEYTLVLTRMPFELNGTRYQLGFNKTGTAFTDYSQHGKKFIRKGETPPLSKMSTMFEKIREWIDTYGRMIVSSSSIHKTETYRKIFARNEIEVSKHSGEGFGAPYLLIG